MKIKTFFILLCIPLLFLAGCTSDNQTQQDEKSKESSSSNENAESDGHYATTGYIVSKDEDSIWVMPNIKKGELMGKSQEDLDALLKEKYEAGEGVDFKLDKIDKQTISSLQVGQKVVVTHDSVGLSAPQHSNAIEIRVLKE